MVLLAREPIAKLLKHNCQSPKALLVDAEALLKAY